MKQRKYIIGIAMTLMLTLILSGCVFIGNGDGGYEEEPICGEDWHTWRAYTSECNIAGEFSVVFSDLDGGLGFAVYDAMDGTRIGTVLFDEEWGYTVSNVDEPFVEDLDGDGVNEIGINAQDGSTLWYCYSPEDAGTWPDDIEAGFLFSHIEKPETESTDNTALSDQLMNQLGNKLEGKMLVETGEEEIDGVMCQTFALGTDTEEKFTAEEHYAINPEGKIYCMDIIQGPDWIPYVPES